MVSDRHIIWAAWTTPGLEHLHLLQRKQGWTANGLIILAQDDVPQRIQYQVRCDARFCTRRVDIRLLQGKQAALALRTDGKGTWTDGGGTVLPDLQGCLDVDISATPFTNTLAIRRLSLKPGQSADLTVVYVAVPDLHVAPVEQRYTCVQTDAGGGVYTYEGLFRNVCADLPVDEDGLVIDYPKTFRRVWENG